MAARPVCFVFPSQSSKLTASKNSQSPTGFWISSTKLTPNDRPIILRVTRARDANDPSLHFVFQNIHDPNPDDLTLKKCLRYSGTLGRKEIIIKKAKIEKRNRGYGEFIKSLVYDAFEMNGTDELSGIHDSSSATDIYKRMVGSLFFSSSSSPLPRSPAPPPINRFARR